jgi:hypothetical protein
MFKIKFFPTIWQFLTSWVLLMPSSLCHLPTAHPF